MPEQATVLLVELLRFLFIQRVGPAELELVVGQRDRASPRAWVDQERPDALEHRERQWQHAAEDPGVDRDRGRREASAREHQRHQAPGRVPHERRLPVEGLDHLGRVIGDLPQGHLGEDIRVGPRLLDGLRIARPVRRQRRVAGLLEEVHPVRPAAGQHPEAVDEDNRSIARGIGSLDLSVLPVGN